MKIKTSSWHYKWIARHWDTDPLSLCWYFWKIVLSIILLTGVGIAALIGVSMIGYIITYPFWQWFYPEHPTVVIAFSFMFWIAIGIIANRTYRSYLYHSGKLARPMPKPYKEPGLAVQWLTAKHRKVCPLLEYTHE